MNDFDDVHELLSRVSADAPDRPDLAAAASGRARRVRRNRRLAIASATAVALAGVVALVIPILPNNTEGEQRVVIQPATPTPSPTDSSPAPEATPTPTPAPVVTPTPSSSPLVIDSGPAIATPTPTPTPTESLAYSVSTHLGPDASTGYPLTVVDVHVTGYLPGDIVGSPYLFIDPNETMGYVVGKDEGCSNDGSWRTFDRTFTFSYAFREATTYPIHLNYFTGVCADHYQGASQNFRTTINVSAGSTHSNGPSQPYFYTPFYNSSVSGGQIIIGANLLDDDGNITQYTVDWGNGDAPTVYPVQQPCHDPSPSGKYWPYSALTRHATSPTLAPGTYTVTITETSAGCDGNDPQTASTSHTFTVPAS